MRAQDSRGAEIRKIAPSSFAKTNHLYLLSLTRVKIKQANFSPLAINSSINKYHLELHNKKELVSHEKFTFPGNQTI